MFLMYVCTFISVEPTEMFFLVIDGPFSSRNGGRRESKPYQTEKETETSTGE